LLEKVYSTYACSGIEIEVTGNRVNTFDIIYLKPKICSKTLSGIKSTNKVLRNTRFIGTKIHPNNE